MNNLPVITINAADIDYSGKRILVVEDNAINLEIALEFLSCWA